MANTQKTTISDVAALAKVSIKTVSRVINNEVNVKPDTRERVLKAVDALNYRPNVYARSLAGQRSYLIGMLYDNPSISYITNVIMGGMAACRKHGYHLLVEEIDGNNENIGSAVSEIVDQSGLNGMILTQPICDNTEILKILTAKEIPFVCMAPDNISEALLSVRMDDYKAAYDLTEYLISLGHKDIAFIKGHPDYPVSRLRYNGFRDAITHHSMALNSDYIQQGFFSYRSGLECGEKLLAGSVKRPTAIFASNDDMAAGVIATAHKLNINIPGDLSVTGFDDNPMASIIWPQLTTVHQPIIEMANAAVNLLVSHISGKRYKEETVGTGSLDFKIIIRESTAAAPAS